MRIGITCYPTHGGSGVVATELGKHLAERGHEVAFISYSTPHRLGYIPEGVTYHEVQGMEYPLLKEFPVTLALASKMAEVARMKKLQVLHVHYAIPFASAAIMARQIVPELNLKVVTTLHGTDVTLVGTDPSFKSVTRLAIEQSDYVTAVSNFLRDQTYEKFKVNNEIQTIYNFIDPDRYENMKYEIGNRTGNKDTPCNSSDSKDESKDTPCSSLLNKLDKLELEDTPCNSTLKIKNSPLTLMHISNFRPVKRVPDVVETFSKVLQHIDARLVLVGDGPDSHVAAKMAHNLGISDRVVFAGIVDEVSCVLKAADILLLPSETESFGLVALEAMAAGVPVVASDVGGLSEVVAHGECGFLAPLGDTDTMAERVLDLVRSPDDYRRYSENARSIAVNKFHYQDLVSEYEQLYQRAVEL